MSKANSTDDLLGQVDVMSAAASSHMAQSPEEIARDLDAVLSRASSEKLESQLSAADCTVALSAAWERARRTMPEERQREWIEPSSEVISRFLGVVEGRTRLPIPPVWEASMLSVKCFSRNFLFFPVAVAQAGTTEKRATRALGIRPTRKGGHWVAATGNQTISLAATNGIGRVDFASVELTDHQIAYVALYDWPADPYRLYAIDRSSGNVIWESDVWAGGNLGVDSHGRGEHVVELRVNDGKLALFGVSDDRAYIEIFDTKNGQNECRFCTMYFDVLDHTFAHPEEGEDLIR